MRRWQAWLQELPKLEQVAIDRCFKPPNFGEVSSTQLHHFSDASQQGYGAVTYLRITDRSGNTKCSFVMGKSRLAPMKSVTVPRMELSAAVVATRLDTMSRKELSVPIFPQAADNSWLVDFKARVKEVTLKDVMGNDFPVTSGIQLWHNIITHMDQTMMKDVTTTSVAWKTAKNDAATVSLKSTWKPTFEWKQDTLVLKAIPHQDVYARDAANKVQPLSTVGIRVDFAQKFGHLPKTRTTSIN